MHRARKVLNLSISQVITMDVVNPLSLSSVASVCDDSDDEEIITAVGGAIAFIASDNTSRVTNSGKMRN